MKTRDKKYSNVARVRGDKVATFADASMAKDKAGVIMMVVTES